MQKVLKNIDNDDNLNNKSLKVDVLWEMSNKLLEKADNLKKEDNEEQFSTEEDPF